MPTIPPIKATTKLYTSAGLINRIIDNTPELEGIPHAQDTTDSIRMVGQQITSFAPRMNAFRNALINRIGMMRMHYMLFTNPWSWAKQGKLEIGESIEQIWLGLAAAYPYDPEKSEIRFMKQHKPDIKSAFHSVNYQMVYSVTVNEYQLQRAFLSLDGLKDFVEEIIGSVARSVSYDEFLLMKYLLAVLLLEGKIKTKRIPQITKENSDEVITTVTGVTNAFQFPSSNYTIAGNLNTTKIDDLYIIETAQSNAFIKVNSLATAYNVDYVKFMGHVVMCDSFGTFDWDRMDMLFADDSGYRRFTTAEEALLESVQLIAMDRKFMQFYDSIEFMATPFINGDGAYTNYPYHTSKIASASPFHNCVAFADATNSVTSVTVTPSEITVDVGQNGSYQAIVSTEGFAESDVIWEITNSGLKEGTYISQDGILHIDPEEVEGNVSGGLTIRATSVFDESKYGEALANVNFPTARAANTEAKTLMQKVAK